MSGHDLFTFQSGEHRESHFKVKCFCFFSWKNLIIVAVCWHGLRQRFRSGGVLQCVEKLIIFFKENTCKTTVSEHLIHHKCNNIGTYKRGRRLFMRNPERCTDLFVVVFKLEGRWVGQNQSERCSNLEIHTGKWTVPKVPTSISKSWGGHSSSFFRTMWHGLVGLNL